MSDADQVVVTILEREYRIQCPPGERAALTEAAQRLDQQMRSIRQAQRTLPTERVAVLAALVFASAAVKSEHHSGDSEDQLAGQLRALSERIGAALASG
jgi:cell division protein ZapA